MDVTETFLPSTNLPKPEINQANDTTTDFFDFVDTSDTSTTFNRSLKSLGVFIEPNNNNDKSETSKDCQYDVFWNSEKEKISTNILEDINTWSDWKADNQTLNNNDGSVYTLTVLNSSETWYRIPEETPPSTSKQKLDPPNNNNSNLDLDNLLNNIQETNNYYYNQNYKTEFFEDSGYCETKDDTTNFDINNPFWKNDTNNNNPNNGLETQDSLLRNALQGKSFQKTYNTSLVKRDYVDNIITSPYPVHDDKPILDDIFKEINNFTEDYEKLKVNESNTVPADIYALPEIEVQVPSISLQSKTNNKKYNRRSTGNGGAISVSVKNGVRKERSLHYCSICSKGFKDKYSVNVHVRTHTGEKPFACNLCGKSFRQKAHLAKHYQTHLAQSQKQHQVSSNGSSCSKSRKVVDHR